ncbi:MAG: hypothetical protein R3326_00550 [Gemmatimonadota bacterium]|nr:hypothetical protein [Gemmatimonadota bacterium]
MIRRVLPPLTIFLFSLAVLGAAPDDLLAQDETIDACVHSGSGVFYLPDDRADGGENCSRNDASLSWNEQGPPGPQGEPGPAGPPGVVDVNVVQEYGSHTSVSAGDVKDRILEVHCSTNEKVLGGGGSIAAVSTGGSVVLPDPGSTLVGSKPVTSSAQGWQVIYRLDNRDGDEAATVRLLAHAICAELAT